MDEAHLETVFGFIIIIVCPFYVQRRITNTQGDTTRTCARKRRGECVRTEDSMCLEQLHDAHTWKHCGSDLTVSELPGGSYLLIIIFAFTFKVFVPSRRSVTSSIDSRFPQKYYEEGGGGEQKSAVGLFSLFPPSPPHLLFAIICDRPTSCPSPGICRCAGPRGGNARTGCVTETSSGLCVSVALLRLH